MKGHMISKGNLIKETNYKKILQLIGEGEQLTKLDIAYTLKISIPTVTTNINELRDAGIIDEVESDIYTGGRRPKIIKVIPNARVSIGIGITKFHVTVVIMNLVNEVLDTKDIDFDAPELMDYLKKGKEIAMSMIQALEIPDEHILGIGLSIPGTINRFKGIKIGRASCRERVYVLV